MILGATAVTFFPRAGMLPQPGTLSFPLGIRRESLMQNHIMTPVARTDAPPTNSVGLQVWGPPPKRRPFAAAMSWLVNYFIDGFAAYGEMICPCLVDMPDLPEDRKRPVSAAPWPLYRRPQADEMSLPRAAPPAREGIGARVTRWLSWFRPRRDHTPPGYLHERLDDRTLRDIGLPPDYPNNLERYLERYVDHGGW